MRKIDAISRHLCKTLFTETFRVDESIKKYTLIENFLMISNRALVSPLERFQSLRRKMHFSLLQNLLSLLDNLPTNILHSAEHESRLHRKEKMRQGKHAMNEQNMFTMLEKQLRNHFTKTPKPRKSSRGKARMRLLSLFSMATHRNKLAK